jgi:hypothetical protein
MLRSQRWWWFVGFGCCFASMLIGYILGRLTS